MERNFKGRIRLPMQMVLAIIKTCQVLDLELPYNILLRRSWIHALQGVPSTFHQFLKFPHIGKEVTIYFDLEPFHYCAKLEEKYKKTQHVPRNEILFHSCSYVDLSSLPSTSTLPTDIPKSEVKV